MKKEELEQEIAKKLKEIKDMYYKAYPDGDYLTLCIFKNRIGFNNENYKADSGYPINYFEEDTEDDNESI